MRFPLPAIAVSVALLLLSAPSAYAAYSSAVVGTTATMTGDAAGDVLAITQAGGLFRHNRFTAGDIGFNSDFDFDSSVAGDQTIASATGIVNIAAGDGNDTIVLGDGINLRGTIDGGIGVDTLDYSAYTTAIRANLGLGSTGLAATLGADQENPPTAHAATATATLTNYSVTARTFDITVTVTGLPPADVTGFHIHQGPVGVNGPIIVDFTGVAPLVPSGTGFTFTAVGLTLPSTSEAAFLGGGTYVNIHTATFPAGAIRGQVFTSGNVNLAAGAATGATSVANIENVAGGAGADSLVGNFSVNVINGGPGADWIVGGPGNDTLNGDAGADAIVWSNGDGSDIDEGGADSDTVLVNGSTAAGDVFLVSPNGTRLRFDRTNLGLFSLDIGTTETLTVNGIGGADSFTVNSLAGVASLTTLNQNGFDGNDVFTYLATTAGPVAFNVHGGTGTDTLQGPNGAAIWNVTAANQGNIAGLVTSFRFIEGLNGGSASDTFNVKAFAGGAPTIVSGGAGADTLNYDAEFRGIAGDRTPPDGAIDSPGVQSVTFTQVETVNIVNPHVAGTVVNDFDGDGKADITVFRPSDGTWFTLRSGTSTLSQVSWGASIDVAVPGDYDGDGKTDIAVYRPSTGTWFILGSSVGFTSLNFGSPADVPVPADYDGDGKTDIAVYRASTALWFILESSNLSAVRTVEWGEANTDAPVPEDYDGDGKTDIAVYRSSTGEWFILQSSTATLRTVQWGGAGTDLPVSADYDGDGTTDIAVFRPETGTWFILNSAVGSATVVNWGSSTDVPVAADFDGDGKIDIAVYRPSDGTWFVFQSSTATLRIVMWGGPGDLPGTRRR